MHLTAPLFLTLASLAIASEPPSTNPTSTTSASSATPCSTHSPSTNPPTNSRTISLGIAHSHLTTVNPTLTLTSTLTPPRAHTGSHKINGTNAWPTALYANHSSLSNTTTSNSNSSSAAKPSGNNGTVSTGKPTNMVPKVTGGGNRMVPAVDVGFAMVGGLVLLGVAAVL